MTSDRSSRCATPAPGKQAGGAGGGAAQASPDLSAAWLPNVSRRLACWCGRDAAALVTLSSICARLGTDS